MLCLQHTPDAAGPFELTKISHGQDRDGWWDDLKEHGKGETKRKGVHISHGQFRVNVILGRFMFNTLYTLPLVFSGFVT